MRAMLGSWADEATSSVGTEGQYQSTLPPSRS